MKTLAVGFAFLVVAGGIAFIMAAIVAWSPLWFWGLVALFVISWVTGRIIES